MSKIFVAAAFAALIAAPALAEETVVTEHHGSPGVSVGVPGVAGVHVGGTGCSSRTVHREDDVGDSKTVHSTNCN